MAATNENNVVQSSKKPCKRNICAAWGCNNYKGRTKSISFFHFPKENELCKRWIHKLRRADLDKLDAKKLRNYLVCEKHFSDDQISKTPTKGKRVNRKMNERHNRKKINT